MIGVVHRQTTAGAVETFALGPLWVGLVLRGIWFSFQGSVATSVSASASICGARPVLLADVDAGAQLVRSDLFQGSFGSMNALRFLIAANVGRELVLPVYVPIQVDGLWVGVALGGPGAIEAACGLVVEPERLTTPALEPGTAARRGRRNGNVMDELRRAAELARG